MPSVARLGAALVLALSGCGGLPPIRADHVPNAVSLDPLAGLDLLVPVPEDNPLTVEKVALGERLFFDAALSADGAVRCASCHRPDRSFSDTVAVSRGVFGRRGQRNAPALVNRAYGRAFFWDGRAPTLEVQVLHPIQDSVELGQPLPVLVRRLAADQSYRKAFNQAFAAPVSSSAIGRALASYVRTLRSGNAPIDRWRDGDTTALSIQARRGLALFTGRANCTACHVGPNFTDEDFHNTGVAARSARYAAFDSGRSRITNLPADVGAFKTPTLREVARTAPYMHDGSLRTLETVVAFYDSGGVAGVHLDPEIKPLGLTRDQRDDLIAFLEALTGTMPAPGPQRAVRNHQVDPLVVETQNDLQTPPFERRLRFQRTAPFERRFGLTPPLSSNPKRSSDGAVVQPPLSTNPKRVGHQRKAKAPPGDHPGGVSTT